MPLLPCSLYSFYAIAFLLFLGLTKRGPAVASLHFYSLCLKQCSFSLKCSSFLRSLCVHLLVTYSSDVTSAKGCSLTILIKIDLPQLFSISIELQFSFYSTYQKCSPVFVYFSVLSPLLPLICKLHKILIYLIPSYQSSVQS